MPRWRLAFTCLCIGMMATGGVSARGSGAGSYVYLPGSPTPPLHTPRRPLSEADMKDLQRPALVDDGRDPTVNAGPIAKGQPFMTLGVRHTFTGVLATEVRAEGWFTSAKAAAGTPVFGLPMGGPDGPGIVWCAPQRKIRHKAPGPWQSVCLPYGDASNVWIKAEPALLPLNLTWEDQSAQGAQAPQVTRGPADLPSMTLSYLFDGWDMRGWLMVRETIDWGDGPQNIRAIALPVDSRASATLKLMNGRLTIARPSDGAVDKALVTEDAPPRAGQPVVF